MYGIADIEQISVHDASSVMDGTADEAKIEDLILLTSEQTMISAGLEALEDLVSKISEEIRKRGIPTDSSFDAGIHETKYEEFQRRYKV